MDLGAYVQIEDLDQIAKENGIEIPRLRGYRLMKDEEPISQDEIKKIKKQAAIDAAKELCQAEPFWNPNSICRIYDSYTDYLTNYYLIKGKDDDGYEEYIDIRWDRIHGKKRKILKLAIKQKERRVQAQYDAWNRYAGKENILYIHSRMGGGNWKYYEDKNSIVKQPWFLERVDDWWDKSYCDFYAQIK